MIFFYVDSLLEPDLWEIYDDAEYVLATVKKQYGSGVITQSETLQIMFPDEHWVTDENLFGLANVLVIITYAENKFGVELIRFWEKFNKKLDVVYLEIDEYIDQESEELEEWEAWNRSYQAAYGY